MLVLLPCLFFFLIPLLVFLVVYETSKGIAVMRRGARPALFTKDFFAAAALVGLIAVILFVWGKYFHWAFL